MIVVTSSIKITSYVFMYSIKCQQYYFAPVLYICIFSKPFKTAAKGSRNRLDHLTWDCLSSGWFLKVGEGEEELKER